MVAIHETQLNEDARRELEEAIARITSAIRARYPEALFDVDCIADDEIHLITKTNEDHDRELMELADEEVDLLEDRHGIFLAIVPIVSL